MRGRGIGLVIAGVLAVGLLAECSGSSPKLAGKSATTPTEASTTSATSPATSSVSEESPTTLPPGAVAGLDDFNGDGQPDPTCGTQDFGGGLILRIPCSISTAHTPEQGTTLVKDSLYRLPAASDVDATGISAEIVASRDVSGAKVVIVVFNTDALFDTGSAAINSTDTLNGTIQLINAKFAGSHIQVRGHTDSTGSASANQALSERRASTVKDYLQSHGVQASDLAAVGFGSTQPLVNEQNPDGTSIADAMRFNRRVEIVIRPK